MKGYHSPYYPPRARWYSGLFKMAYAIRYRLFLDRITPITGLNWRQMLLSLLPGYGPWASGRRMIAQILLAFYLATVLGFLICLGYPLANFLFGLAISLHTISIAFTFTRVFASQGLGKRIGMSLILPPVLCLGLYFPMFRFCTSHWFMPLRIRDKVVVVNCWAKKSPPKRGEWLAYRFEEWSGPHYLIRSGYSLDPVLARAGQRVVFFPDRVEIDGQVHKRIPGMPESGEVEVSKNHCLIWPSSANVYGNPNAGPEIADRFFISVSMVPKERWIGKPFKHWFFRQQRMP